MIVMTSPSRLNVKKTRDAKVRIRANAEDDNYIQRVELLYQAFAASAGSDGAQHIGVKTLELYDAQKDRWTGPGEDPMVSYEHQRDIEHLWNLEPLNLKEMGRVSMQLRITDGFDLRHLPTAQDCLGRLALTMFNGYSSLDDFWERLDIPEDVRKRLMVMVYDGLIREKEIEINASTNARTKSDLEQERDEFTAKRDGLRIEVLRDLIKRLDEKKRATEDVVDIFECEAKIARAYYDIARLENKSGEVLKEYEKKFKKAAMDFKDKVAERNIFAERDLQWDYIDGTLKKDADTYYEYASQASPDAPGLSEEESKSLETLRKRFVVLVVPLREMRQKVSDELRSAKQIPEMMNRYIRMVKEATLSGENEFRDLRSLEELEQRALDAPPDNELDAFLLYAKICLKIEEAIAKALKHIDILQWRTSELRRQNFLNTWDDLGRYDSFDLRELGVAVRSNRSDEEIKMANIEDKKATLGGEISELKQAIRRYCEKNNIPVEGQGFIPRPPEEPAGEEGGEEGNTSLHGSALPFFTRNENGEGGESQDPEAEGGEAPPEAPQKDVINNDLELLGARYLGWEKEQELKDLEGAEARYNIFKNIEVAIEEAGKWVGPNFYETDMLQLNIVSRLDKQADVVRALVALGKKIEAIRDVQSDDAVAALSRFMDLCNAARGYNKGAAQSEERLLRMVRQIYPNDIEKLEAKFRDKETGTIDAGALLDEIQRFKVNELATAWASQKTIVEDLPEVRKTAEEIRDEFIDNGFEGSDAVHDLTREAPNVEETDEGGGKARSKGKGIIPTLLTLERVLAPDLVRLTDDLQQRSDDNEILLRIDDVVLPEQMQMVVECEHMLKVIRKYIEVGELIRQIRRLRQLEDAVRIAIELGVGD